MHNADFLQDLAVVMITAAVVTILFHRFRQPVVLGYILAGIIIGPNTALFSLISDETAIHTLADLGVVFLLFSIGLRFSLRKVRRVGSTALLVALFEITLLFWIGYEIAQAFDWSKMDSIFLGGMISISSSTIIFKTLTDSGKTQTKFGELVFGILVIEDIVAILMITLLSGIAMTGSLAVSEVMTSIGRLSIFILTAILVSLLFLPRFLVFVARFQSNEMLLITVLGLCFGVSLLAVKFDYSAALGAFLIGSVIGDVCDLKRISVVTEPVRDMFSAVFFVAVGLMINPADLIRYIVPVLVIAGFVILGKGMACSLGAFIVGYRFKDALQTGISMSMIGEFSFIIAALGSSLGVTGEFLYPIIVSVSAVTVLLTPNIMKKSEQITASIEKFLPRTLRGFLVLYTQRLLALREKPFTVVSIRYIRKILLRIIVDVVLIAGVFITAVFFSGMSFFQDLEIPVEIGGARGVLWLLAVILSFPLYFASHRQMRVLSMILSELSVTGLAKDRRRRPIQHFVEQVLNVIGILLLVLFTIYLSSALLPPGDVLVVMSLLLVLLIYFLRRAFLRLYDKAEYHLLELSRRSVDFEDKEEKPRPSSVVRRARLASLVIPPFSPAAGRLIRELELRTRTGATVVVIERDNQVVLNPDPEEILREKDKILLIGSTQEIKKAREFLVPPVSKDKAVAPRL